MSDHQGIEQVSQLVQTNSTTAEESAAASEALSGQAELLKNLMSEFKLRGKSDRGVSTRSVVTSHPQKLTEATIDQHVELRIMLDDMEIDKY